MTPEIIVFFTLAAALGSLLGAIKMHRTPMPQMNLHRPAERHF